MIKIANVRTLKTLNLKKQRYVFLKLFCTANNRNPNTRLSFLGHHQGCKRNVMCTGLLY